MKVNGYRIKEAISAFAMARTDLDLSVVASPEHKPDLMGNWKESVVEKSDEFQKNLVILQLLLRKETTLNSFLNEYNSKVSDQTSGQTITDILAEINYISSMLNYVQRFSSNVEYCEDLTEKNKKYPLITKEKLGAMIRQFLISRTKLEHQIDILNATEIELEGLDPSLFDEKSWVSMDFRVTQEELSKVIDTGIISGMQLNFDKIRHIDDALQNRFPDGVYSLCDKKEEDEEDAVDGIPDEILSRSTEIIDDLFKRDQEPRKYLKELQDPVAQPEEIVKEIFGDLYQHEVPESKEESQEEEK